MKNEHDETGPQSTGNPRDYLQVEDFTDIGKGKRVVLLNSSMPSEADIAWLRWLQGKSHLSCRDWVSPAAETFTRIMGFSPEQLQQAKKDLQQTVGEFRHHTPGV